MLACGCYKTLTFQFQYFQSVVAFGCYTVRVLLNVIFKLPGRTIAMVSAASRPPRCTELCCNVYNESVS